MRLTDKLESGRTRGRRNLPRRIFNLCFLTKPAI
jgi:hypothetical protein